SWSTPCSAATNREPSMSSSRSPLSARSVATLRAAGPAGPAGAAGAAGTGGTGGSGGTGGTGGGEAADGSPLAAMSLFDAHGMQPEVVLDMAGTLGPY